LWLLGLPAALAVVLVVLYYLMSMPAMPVEQMKQLFAEAREHVASAPPERVELGKAYLKLFESAPELPEDARRYFEPKGEEYLAAAQKWHKANARRLPDVYAVTANGPGAIPFHPGAESEHAKLGWVHQSVVFGRLLQMDLPEAARAGDYGRVLLDAKALACIAQTLDQSHTLFCRLQAAGIRRSALAGILSQRAVVDGQTAKVLIGLLEQMESALPPPGEWLWEQMAKAEIACDRGCGLTDLYNDTRTGALQGKPGKLPRGIGRRAIIRQIGLGLQALQEMQAAAKLPPRDAIPELKRIVERFSPSGFNRVTKWSRLFAWAMVRIIPSGYEYEIDDLAAIRGARVVLAIELHRRHRGDFPKQLAALAPDFVKAVPPDPFSGEGFRYVPCVTDYTLYSVGANLTDDGGKRPRAASPGENLLMVGDDYIILGPPPGSR
jgi:hypothetical protein